MKEKGLMCSKVLEIIVLRSNYICLSSFTALLWLKRELYAICYLPDYPLSRLSLLTSIDAVPAIPLINLYLQSVILTCAVNTLPSAVCRAVCDVAVMISLAIPYVSAS